MNYIMNSKGIIQKINTIFMNFKISKTSNPHRLLLNLTDKIGLKGKDKYIASSNLNIFNGAALLLTLCIKLRCWYKLI